MLANAPAESSVKLVRIGGNRCSTGTSAAGAAKRVMHPAAAAATRTAGTTYRKGIIPELFADLATGWAGLLREGLAVN
jgi:hypothetical protein